MKNRVWLGTIGTIALMVSASACIAVLDWDFEAGPGEGGNGGMSVSSSSTSTSGGGAGGTSTSSGSSSSSSSGVGNGALCGMASECVSSFCADGVCCNSACTGTCQACNLVPGTCSPVPFSQDDADTCSGTTQSCNGAGACKKENGQSCSANTDCWSNICNGGSCTEKSCTGLSENCGMDSKENCCVSSVVTGGTYNRSNDAMYPATVSNFRLDRFEITVGRFRKFVEAYPGSKPASGDGAHPVIAGSGWDATWNASLPADQAALKAAITCINGTWTDAAGANENLPINCSDWYMSFAFCAWDGGRLPTEAEWNYAAAGGSEQRLYPWGATMPDATYAVHDCLGDGSAAANCSFADILKVGSKSPKGDGMWGQADLSGSMFEWNLDWYESPYVGVCSNCANLLNGSNRVMRGGDWNNHAGYVFSSHRNSSGPQGLNNITGARCARTP